MLLIKKIFHQDKKKYMINKNEFLIRNTIFPFYLKPLESLQFLFKLSLLFIH
jgi:hypothetical protein